MIEKPNIMVRQTLSMNSVLIVNKTFQKRERRNRTMKRSLYGIYVTKLMSISKYKPLKIP